jgi:hypothetical protein
MTTDELRSSLEANGIRVPPSGLLRASVVALILDKSASTLQDWRRAGLPPHAVRLNGQWHYSIASLADWMTGQS